MSEWLTGYVIVFVLIVMISGMRELYDAGYLKGVLLMATLNVFWLVFYIIMKISMEIARKKLLKHSEQDFISVKTTAMWGIKPGVDNWASPKNLMKIIFTKPKKG